MPATLESLVQEALVLPPDQRVELATRMMESVDSTDAWDAEIKHRIERLDAGEAELIPATVVLASLRRAAPDR